MNWEKLFKTLFGGKSDMKMRSDVKREISAGVTSTTARTRSGSKRLAASSKDGADTKSYPMGLVGESHYQVEIAKLSVGDCVHVAREVGNPFDEEAVVVLTMRRRQRIGYVPRDSFVYSGVNERGQGVDAVIKSINGKRPTLGVVLDVKFNWCEPELVNYKQ